MGELGLPPPSAKPARRASGCWRLAIASYGIPLALLGGALVGQRVDLLVFGLITLLGSLFWTFLMWMTTRNVRRDFEAPPGWMSAPQPANLRDQLQGFPVVLVDGELENLLWRTHVTRPSWIFDFVTPDERDTYAAWRVTSGPSWSLELNLDTPKGERPGGLERYRITGQPPQAVLDVLARGEELEGELHCERGWLWCKPVLWSTDETRTFLLETVPQLDAIADAQDAPPPLPPAPTGWAQPPGSQPVGEQGFPTFGSPAPTFEAYPAEATDVNRWDGQR